MLSIHSIIPKRGMLAVIEITISRQIFSSVLNTNWRMHTIKKSKMVIFSGTFLLLRPRIFVFRLIFF